MKKQLLTLALTIGTLFATPALAQVNYNNHSLVPNTNYGSQTNFIAGIRFVTDYVNGRQTPSTNSKVISSFFSHQPVQVVRVFPSSTGYTWYLVYESNRGQYGWIRGDMLN